MTFKCPHDRKVNLSVKLRDNMLSFTWPNGVVTQDDTPQLGGLIDASGYLDVNVCIDCHVVINMLPSGYLLAKQPEPQPPKAAVPYQEPCQLCGEVPPDHATDCPL